MSWSVGRKRQARYPLRLSKATLTYDDDNFVVNTHLSCYSFSACIRFCVFHKYARRNHHWINHAVVTHQSNDKRSKRYLSSGSCIGSKLFPWFGPSQFNCSYCFADDFDHNSTAPHEADWRQILWGLATQSLVHGPYVCRNCQGRGAINYKFTN